MSPTYPPSSAPPPPRASAALQVERRGSGSPLVLAHGFTQTGRAWGPVTQHLAAHHLLVLVDMPGHGGSATVQADLIEGARLLGEAGGHADYLGYSMGARFCLHLALARPELIDHLVLVSGTAGIDDPEQRRARRQSDEALAGRLDPRGAGPAVDAVEDFIRRWLDRPLFAGLSPEAVALGERLRNTGPGLASSLRLAGAGTQQPLWDRLDRLTMPVLIVTGELDEKFTALGHRMAAAIGPNATQVVIAGTGHAPHLQRPREVARLVLSHLAAPPER